MPDRRGDAPDGSSGGEITFCIVPPGHEHLAALLRRYYGGDTTVEIRIERRIAERRRPGDRRAASSALPPADDRRRIRNPAGRRIGERRATTVPVPALPLPLIVRRRSEQLAFVRRIEPSPEQLRDLDAGRTAIRFQAGEEGALEELYRIFYDQIYRYARIVLRGRPDAEDVAQQTFVNAIKALPDFEVRAGESVRAWLYQIARNVALDVLRGSARTLIETPEEIDRRREAPTDEVVETLQWIQDKDLALFVRRLPPAQAELLTLRYKLDLGLDQIARIVGSNPEAVKRMHARALRTLEDRLAGASHRPLRSRRAWSRVRMKTNPVLASRRFALVGPLSRTGRLTAAAWRRR